jgi:predicted phosphoadenosine phosphosulfate sulfurtransferase
MRFLSSSMPSSVRRCSRSLTHKLAFWIHPGGRIVGCEVISEAATEIREHFPEYRYMVTGEIQIMHNVATCQWGSGMPDQRSTTRGQTSSKRSMVTCQGCTRFIDQKLFQS